MLTGKYSDTGFLIDGNAFIFRVKQYKSQYRKKFKRTLKLQ